jgi:tetraacyldisaccharide 4'-kinase
MMNSSYQSWIYRIGVGKFVNRLFQSIQHSWYQKPTWLNKVLLPLSYGYQLGIVLRRVMYRYGIKKITRFSVPVIVVGNITVGGTGKTPFVVWLAAFLKEQGFKPGIVSKGYGGKASQQPTAVTSTSNPFDVGDEAVVLARKTDCPVVVANNRPAGVQYLLDTFQPDIVISDDGLQHYALGRDIEIVMLDGTRRLGNHYCLPAGPLREPPSRLQQVNFIIVTEGLPQLHEEYEMQLVGDHVVQLINPLNIVPIDSFQINSFQSKKCYAVAGIGNPERFFSALRRMKLQCEYHPFTDHYPFQWSDFNFAEAGSVILMTEKDAVKCQGFADERFWYLPVKAKMSDDFKKQFMVALQSELKT